MNDTTTRADCAPRWLSARRQLDQALRELHERRQKTPCAQFPKIYFSSLAASRRLAAEMCRDECPVLAACASFRAALDESHPMDRSASPGARGVWGGNAQVGAVA